MRLMRYPGGLSSAEVDIRNFGISAHTDFEVRLGWCCTWRIFRSQFLPSRPHSRGDRIAGRASSTLIQPPKNLPFPCVLQAFTLLHQDAPGLQLQSAAGEWADAPVPALGARSPGVDCAEPGVPGQRKR